MSLIASRKLQLCSYSDLIRSRVALRCVSAVNQAYLYCFLSRQFAKKYQVNSTLLKINFDFIFVFITSKDVYDHVLTPKFDY